MADRFPYLVKTTTSTTGSNPYVLGTADLPSAHRTPKQAIADGSLTDGDTVQYMCRDTSVSGDANFERGFGIYTDATNTIARTAANVFDSSNGPGVLFSWPASGVRDIYLEDIDESKVAKLDKENVFTEGQRINIADSGNALLRFTNSDTGDLSTDGSFVGMASDESLRLVQFENNDILFFTDATLAMTITADQDVDMVAGLVVNDDVGIGISIPDGKLHVHSGSAGSVTPDTVADDLIVENSATAGITIASPNNFLSNIYFASPGNNNGAQITWSHDSNVMSINARKDSSSRLLLLAGASLVFTLDETRAKLSKLLSLAQTSTAADPTTTEYPNDGDVGVHHNTSSDDRFWVWNDGGTIFKTLMT